MTTNYKGVDLTSYSTGLTSVEGRTNTVYSDPPGSNTLSVGVGHFLGTGGGLKKGDTVTDEQIDAWLKTDMVNSIDGAKRVYENAGGNWDDLPAAQKQNLATMTFNLGEGGVAKFKKAVNSMVAGDYAQAGLEFTGPRRAGQIGSLRTAIERDAFARGVGINRRTGRGSASSLPPLTNTTARTALQNPQTIRTSNAVFKTGTIVKNPPDNILDDYNSVSYHIKLSVVSEQIYQRYNSKVMNSEPITDLWDRTTDKIVIAESGVTGIRCENLEIETRWGVNSESGTSSASTFKIRIIEPHGIVLFDKLYASAVSLGIKNHLKVPYLLEIGFYGRKNDTGEIVFIKDAGIHTYFVLFNNFDSVVDIYGTTYDVQGVMALDAPNYSEFSELDQSITITSGNTVSDVLKNLTESLNKIQVERAKISETMSRPDEYNIIVDGTWPECMNGNSESCVDMGGAKVIVSELYKSIRNESNRLKITEINNKKIGDTDMPDAKNIGNDLNIHFNDGIDIQTMLECIVASTDWAQKEALRSQDTTRINDAKTASQIFKSLFKISTNMEILDTYDYLRNDYTRRITYKITPYVMTTLYASKSDVDIPRADRTKLIYDHGLIRRVYSYIYTGENTQVLEFSIRMNFNWWAVLPQNLQMSYEVSNPGEKASREEDEKKSKERLQQVKQVIKEVALKPEFPPEYRKKAVVGLQELGTKIRENKPLTVEDFEKAKIKKIVPSDYAQPWQRTEIFNMLQAVTAAAQNELSTTDTTVSRRTFVEDYEPGDVQAAQREIPVSWRFSRQENLLKNMETDPSPGRDYFNCLYSQALSTKLFKINMTIKGDPYWLSCAGRPVNDPNPQELVQHFFFLTLKTPIDTVDSVEGQASKIVYAPSVEGLYGCLKTVSKFENGVFTQELLAVKDVETLNEATRQYLKVVGNNVQ